MPTQSHWLKFRLGLQLTAKGKAQKIHFKVKILIMYQNIFQVLRGDLKPAIETHEMLYQVTKQHNFLPEVIND